MLYENWFKNPGDVPFLLKKITDYRDRKSVV